MTYTVESCKQTHGRKEDARVRSEKSDERRGCEWENGFCFINISIFCGFRF